MYILKNALTSITRSKGRNVLIGIIIIVISAACAVTLSIRNSANKIVKSFKILSLNTFKCLSLEIELCPNLTCIISKSTLTLLQFI